MIEEMRIEPEVLKVARMRAKEMPQLKNTIKTDGSSWTIGCIGEDIVTEYLGIYLDNTYEYDITYKKRRLEIKTTLTSVPPRMHYRCSVSAHNPNQKCDYYVFVRISKDFKTAWLLGCIKRDDFYAKADFKEQGEKEPNSSFRYTSDCYTVMISDLEPMSRLRNL